MHLLFIINILAAPILRFCDCNHEYLFIYISRCFLFVFVVDIFESEMLLPKSFTNKIISESGNCIKIRSNIRNMADCNKWVREYGEVSNTHWNSRTSQPNGQKMVCSLVVFFLKIFVLLF